jgi:hypothetical protein
MRTRLLLALTGAALFGLSTISQAAPLSATGALAGAPTTAAIDEALGDQGATQVHWRGRGRHYGWYRGHHYGWRHRHHYPAYGYYPRHRYHRGVSVYVR